MDNSRYNDGLSIRTEEGGQRYITGLALPWWNGESGSEYEIEDGYFERFEKGSVKWDTVVANIQHMNSHLIGITPDTLSLKESKRGIEFEITLDDSSFSRDAEIMVAKRKLRGASIEFRKPTFDYQREGNKNVVYVRSAQLRGISLVARPAYKSTEAYLRDVSEMALTQIYNKRADDLLNTVIPQVVKR